MQLLSHYNLLEHNSIDSTNLEAKRLIQSGEIHSDTIITAKIQTAGRGRLDRQWISGEGNLFTSIVIGINGEGARFTPRNDVLCIPSSFALLPFIAALAVGETLQSLIAAGISYKWPNDVLVEGKKISGILIEVINNYAIIGIGINIAHYPESGTKLRATCLNSHAGDAVSIIEVLESLVHNFDKKMQFGVEEILCLWTERAYKINNKVTVFQENKAISGIYRGIDENGRLILETNEGKREVVSFGDILWI